MESLLITIIMKKLEKVRLIRYRLHQILFDLNYTKFIFSRYLHSMSILFFMIENSRTHRVISIVSNAVPGFLKSSVLGSTLFYIYDKFFESTKSGLTEILKITPASASSYFKTKILPKKIIQNNENTTNSNENSENGENGEHNGNGIFIEEPYNGIFISDSGGNSLLVVWVSSLLVGSLGGTGHGLLHVSWDAATATISNIGKQLLRLLI
jgi:hypothetical protein